MKTLKWRYHSIAVGFGVLGVALSLAHHGEVGLISVLVGVVFSTAAVGEPF